MKIVIMNDNIKINRDISIFNRGTKFSYKWDTNHKVDGPAREYADGGESWRLEGKIHRKYGPARKWNDSYEWWFEGKEYTQEKFMEKFL